MLDAASKAVELVAGTTLQELEDDEVRTLALIRLLEVLGEAANGVSPKMKGEHPELPWADMADTRNRLIHGYFDIDTGIVWRIATDDLTPVIDALQSILGDQ